MKIRPFKALYPELDYITSPDSFFSGIKDEFPEYRLSGQFRKREDDALFIYRIRYYDHAFMGLVALADIADYSDGRIKRHEETLADKEQVHLNLLLRNRAIVKPVLLTYAPVDALTAKLHERAAQSEPDLTIHFEGANIDHSWWAVTDPAFIADVSRMFAEDIGESYIADGHHRISAMSLLRERLTQRSGSDPGIGLLAAFFSADEVEILEFNRIVDVFADISPTLFMARLSALAEIHPAEGPVKPADKHEFGMYLHKEWYSLRWKPEVLQRCADQSVILDAQLFNDEILRGILEVQDIRTDKRITYFPGVMGMEAFRHAVHEKEIRVGFTLHPVSLKEMMTLSDEGGVLPPKSTWFEPRMKNGVIIYDF